MTECQGCGAWNERHRTLCVLCGTPLAETDEWDAASEPPPLPPLPDGGLSVSMPAWLRDTPGDPEPQASAALAFLAAKDEIGAAIPATAGPPAEEVDAAVESTAPEIPPEDAAPADQPLGPRADPRTFLRDDDFPRWIRELPALPPRPRLPVTVNAHPAADPATVAAPPADAPLARSPLPDPVPLSQEAAEPGPQTVVETVEAAEPAPVPAAAAVPAAATGATERQREAWETPLLVVLVVGVVIAVIWALLVNGLIGSML